MLTNFTSTPITANATFGPPISTSMPSTQELPNEALNLSINNRSSNTATTSLIQNPVTHEAISQRDSWPPDKSPLHREREKQEYRSRRDSVDSADQPSSASLKSENNSDESGKERRRRQKLANKDNLLCQVCGDKANGYNFGAITCESCKAFFRRNAQKHQDLKCNFENNCKIDHFTRKFCTACRLSKCFSVNMKKEWILDEEALKKRKKLIRRSIREGSSSKDYDPSGFPAFSPTQVYGACNIPSTAHPTGLFTYIDPPLNVATPLNAPSGSSEDKDYPPMPLDEAERSIIDQIMENHAKMSCSSPSSSAATTPTVPPTTLLPQRLQSPTDQENLVTIKTEPSSEPFVVVEPEDPPEDSPEAPLSNSTESQPENQNLSPQVANHDEDREQPIQPDQIINMAGGFIRRLIVFAKSLPEFGNLSNHDQISLLKGGILETLVIRSAIVYEENADNYSERVEQSNRVLKEIYDKHIKFITSFNDITKWDKVATTLCMVVNLFCAEREDLLEPQPVASACHRYALLLQSYLMSKYTVYEVKSLYPKLLEALTSVRSYGEQSSRQMYGVTPAELEPLMREMFSMK